MKHTLSILFYLIFTWTFLYAQVDDIKRKQGEIVKNGQKEMTCETLQYLWLKNGKEITKFNCNNLLTKTDNDLYFDFGRFGNTLAEIRNIGYTKSYMPYNIANLDTTFTELIGVLTKIAINKVEILNQDSLSKEERDYFNKLVAIKNSTISTINDPNSYKVEKIEIEQISKKTENMEIDENSTQEKNETVFEKIVRVIFHVLIVISLFGIFLYLLMILINAKYVQERLIYIAAVVLGFMLYIMLKKLNILLPEIFLSEIDNNTLGLLFIGLLIPLISGYIVTAIIKNIFAKENLIIKRIVLVLIVFIYIMFIDVYLSSFKYDNGLILLPNISMIVGVLSYVVLKVKYKIEPDNKTDEKEFL